MIGTIKTSSKYFASKDLLSSYLGLHFCREDCKQLNNIDNIDYGTVCGIRGFVCEIHALK